MIYCSVTSDDLITLADAMPSSKKTEYMRELVDIKLRILSESGLLKAKGKYDLGPDGDIHFSRPDGCLIVACITSKEVSNIEAYNFLEDVGASLMKRYTPTQLNVSTAPMCLESFSSTLMDFIYKFNNTEEYKNKADQVFNEFNEVKQVLIDDLEKLLERDNKLDIALIKSNNLQQESRTFKKKAAKYNRFQRRRKYCYIFWSVIVALVIIAAVVLVLKFIIL